MGALDDWRFCPVCGEAIDKVDDRAECRACGLGYANPIQGRRCASASGIGFSSERPSIRKGLGSSGGFLHEDEHPLVAAARIREETALEIQASTFSGSGSSYDGRIVLCLAWMARARGDAQAGDDLVELHWFEPDELPQPSELAFTHYPEVLSAALGGRHEHA
jgi:hypothetical protein